MKEGWEYKKLGEVCDIYQPKTISGKDLVEDGKYLVYGANGVIGKYNSYNHEKSEVLMTCRGATCGTINVSEPYSWINGNAMVVHPRHNILSQNFLFYLLKGLDLSDVITGAAQPQITRQSLAPKKIAIPPLSEQQHIVEELDLLSSIIEKKKAQLKELDNLAQSIFYEMFGDPTKTSKGWEVKKIGDVCILKSGNSDANKSASGDLPYVKVGDMNLEGNETYIVLSSTYVDRVANARNIFPIGTIIFPKRGGAILTNKKRLTKTDICCDLNVMGVIPNTDIVIPLYVYYYFLRIDFSVFANTGSTIPQINNYDIAPMNIVLPPMDVQKQFASNIDSIEGQKELIKQSIKEVETMYNSRMDLLFNM